MKITDNTSLTTFLLGHPIQIFVAEDDGLPLYDIQFNAPTIKQVYCDNKVQIILGLFNTDIDILRSKFKNLTNFTHYTFFTTARTFSAVKLGAYADYLEYAFKLFGVDLKCDKIITINGFPIDEAVFEHIRYILLYAVKMKDKNAQALEQDPRYRENQARIARIKGNKSNGNNEKNFEKNFITLLYEFGLSIEQIEHLNMYQYEHILSYTGKSINYKVSLIAAGNGNTKKVKFITKGDK